jgi:hypothetical protein
MENAIFISKINDLEYATEGYSRLYFGNEFCERLLPSKNELKQVLDFSLEKGLNFSLVTPFVTNKGLGLLDHLLPLLNRNDEVVFNDWGVLELIHSNRLKPVLGRLLTKQKRGPRIINVKEKSPSELMEYFMSSNTEAPIIQEFLIKNNIERVELDNLLQGINQDFSNKRIKASLYYPFLYLTTTRRCIINSCDIISKKDKIGIYPCNKECQKYTVEKENENIPVKLVLKGNTHFFVNNNLPEELENKGINRLVYEPKVPM